MNDHDEAQLFSDDDWLTDEENWRQATLEWERDRGTYRGPTTINCTLNCDVPVDVVISEVPTPRHAWNDVFRCPNDSCDRCFLLVKREKT